MCYWRMCDSTGGRRLGLRCRNGPHGPEFRVQAQEVFPVFILAGARKGRQQASMCAHSMVLGNVRESRPQCQLLRCIISRIRSMQTEVPSIAALHQDSMQACAKNKVQDQPRVSAQS